MKKKLFLLIIGTVYCFTLVTAQSNPKNYYTTIEHYRMVDSLKWAILFNDHNRKIYRDSLKVTDSVVDSIFKIEKTYNIKALAIERDTTIVHPGAKLLKITALKNEEEQNLNQILSKVQYNKWVQLHPIFRSSIRFGTSAKN